MGAVIYFWDTQFWHITYIAFYRMVWTLMCIIHPLDLPLSFQVYHLPNNLYSLCFFQVTIQDPLHFFFQMHFSVWLAELRTLPLRNAFILNILLIAVCFGLSLQACRLGCRSFFAYGSCSVPQILGFGPRNKKCLILV